MWLRYRHGGQEDEADVSFSLVVDVPVVELTTMKDMDHGDEENLGKLTGE